MALLPTQAPPVRYPGVPSSASSGGNITPEHKATIYREHDQAELLKIILTISENKFDLFIKRKTYLQRSYDILRVAEHYLLKEYEQLYGD